MLDKSGRIWGDYYAGTSESDFAGIRRIWEVKVAQLSEELNCSEVTIRNDIKAMEKEGLLQRTHGGAIALEQERKRKYSAESIYRHVDRKKSDCCKCI